MRPAYKKEIIMRRRSLILATCTVLLLVPVIVHAVTISRSNAEHAVVDNNTIIKSITFSAADFGTEHTISDVTVTLDFRRASGTDCADPTNSSIPRHSDTAYYLYSPSSTKVDLIEYDTYANYNYRDRVAVTLDDSASSPVGDGGHTVTGTFRPVEPLSTFTGQNPVGTWYLHIRDANAGSPLCHYGFDLNITTVPSPPRVTSTAPTNTARNVPLDTAITLNFDKPVDVTASGVILDCGSGSLPYTGLPAASAASITLVPDDDLPLNTTCTVTAVAGQITDGAGRQLDGNGDNTGGDNHRFSFTTTGGAFNPTITSPTNVVDANGGQCYRMEAADLPGPDGEVSLQEAICIANADGQPNTITLATSIPLTHPLYIEADGGHALTIDGGGFTLDGGSTTNHFVVYSPNATLNLNNMTLANGYALINAGSIQNSGSLNLAYTTFINNYVTNYPIHHPRNQGGGAIFSSGNLDIRYSTFTNNRTAAHSDRCGGAIYIQGGAVPGTPTVNIAYSTFNGNSGSYGGAIYNKDRALSITNSTFTNNWADEVGGAIFNGPIYSGATGAPTAITNATFVNNRADEYGGAVGGSSLASTITLINATLANNTPNSLMHYSVALHLENVIITGSENCHGLYSGGTVTGMNIFSDSSCLHLASAPSNSTITADPLLGPLANYGGPTQTMALLAGSPAVDMAGATCPAGLGTPLLDQRGAERTDSICDVGAFEYGAMPLPPIVEQDVSGPQGAAPFACDGLEFVGGWGIFAKGTPAENAFTVPEPPAGYSYAASPAHAGWCDVFTVGDHSALPVTVCWTGSDASVIGLRHDIPGDPAHGRTWTIIPTTRDGANVCATLPAFGGVALLNGGSTGSTSEAPASVTTTAPVNCQVTTTHRINFRQTPGGEVVSRVPYQTTLTAAQIACFPQENCEANTPGSHWYRVEWLGQQGWISADYVTAVCE
jgi:hypothetical protein